MPAWSRQCFRYPSLYNKDADVHIPVSWRQQISIHKNHWYKLLKTCCKVTVLYHIYMGKRISGIFFTTWIFKILWLLGTSSIQSNTIASMLNMILLRRNTRRIPFDITNVEWLLYGLSQPCWYLPVFAGHENYKLFVVTNILKCWVFGTNLCIKKLTSVGIDLTPGDKMFFVFDLKTPSTQSLFWIGFRSCIPSTFNFQVMGTGSNFYIDMRNLGAFM